MDEERREFLPPEPAGPEPELGPGPAPQPAPAAYPATRQYPPPQQGGWQPPPPQQPPPPGYPPQQPPPPGYPPYGWQGQAPPGWGYPAPAQPDNGPAVTGFVISLVSVGLLLFSGGLSSVLSIGGSIAAIVVSRKGKAKVDRGETQKNRGLAQAGFIIGIVGLVLAVLATLVWGLILVAALTDDEFRQDLEDELDNPNSVRAGLRLTAIGARLILG